MVVNAARQDVNAFQKAQFSQMRAVAMAPSMSPAAPRMPLYSPGAHAMSSYDKSEVVERGVKDKEEDKDEEQGGFFGAMKNFVQDKGEKIEETTGFGKPTADVSAIHIPKINLERADGTHLKKIKEDGCEEDDED